MDPTSLSQIKLVIKYFDTSSILCPGCSPLSFPSPLPNKTSLSVSDFTAEDGNKLFSLWTQANFVHIHNDQQLPSFRFLPHIRLHVIDRERQNPSYF